MESMDEAFALVREARDLDERVVDDAWDAIVYFGCCEEELRMQLCGTNIQIALSIFGCALWVGL